MISQEELKKFKSQLLEEKARLESDVKGLGNTDFGSDVDSGEEESDETEEILANENIAEALKGRLRRIERALEKIEAGTYGKCERCGKELSRELLNIDPESRLCRDCKK